MDAAGRRHHVRRGWWGVYEVHNTAGMVVLYIIAASGTTLWLWSMYVYIPANYPTWMRSWAPAGPTASATSAPGAAS